MAAKEELETLVESYNFKTLAERSAFVFGWYAANNKVALNTSTNTAMAKIAVCKQFPCYCDNMIQVCCGGCDCEDKELQSSPVA